jgi:hypothetical protein
VRELGATLRADELTEWEAFDRLEPIGPARLEVMLGVLCSLTANAHRGKNSRRYKVGDFIPDYESLAVPVPPPTGDELAAKVRMMNLALGGKETPRGP